MGVLCSQGSDVGERPTWRVGCACRHYREEMPPTSGRRCARVLFDFLRKRNELTHRVIAWLFLKLAIGLSMISSHRHQAHVDSVRGRRELSNRPAQRLNC